MGSNKEDLATIGKNEGEESQENEGGETSCANLNEPVETTFVTKSKTINRKAKKCVEWGEISHLELPLWRKTLRILTPSCIML
jgi:hypothetical protein